MFAKFLPKSCLVLCSLILVVHSQAQQTVGLFENVSGSEEDGYILFAPLTSDTTYLIDKCGRLVHKWGGNYDPGASVYLQPDGVLLKTGDYPNPIFHTSTDGSVGGIIERYDWNDSLLWYYILASDTQEQDHDVAYLPNGNVLAVVWDIIPDSIAIANGRNPALLGSSLWSAELMEIQPVGASGGNIVWQWRLFDHLIQDFDSTKPNYGVVADHPELVNLNFVNPATSSGTIQAWIHENSVAYNPVLDQILVSARDLDEVWVIDHSTSLSQAASHSGGAHSKGGDLLYRWGNPQVYDQGTSANTQFWQQHDATWIPPGSRFENQIMVFDNGYGRPGGNVSSIDIIDPPVDSAGNYSMEGGTAYGPLTYSWAYQGTPPSGFYSTYMGSAQILPNGNVLVDEALSGTFFELDTFKNIVWRYVNPVSSGSPLAQGATVMYPDNEVFKIAYYPSSYPGFTGQTLVAGAPIEVNPLSYVCVTTNGINTLSAANETVVYPNPANNEITITADSLITVEVTDITGKIISSESYSNTNSATLSTASLTPGVYILRINGSQYQKILVQH